MIVLVILSMAWSSLTDGMRSSRVDALAAHVAQLGDIAPGVDMREHVAAAIIAETPRVSAELLLSIAWSESRFDPSVHTSRVCGPLQVNPTDLGRSHDAACEAWSVDLIEAYAAGADEIETMLHDPRVHGSLTRALAYRACGNAAFVADSACVRAKKSWPAWVLYRARKLGEP